MGISEVWKEDKHGYVRGEKNGKACTRYKASHMKDFDLPLSRVVDSVTACAILMVV